MLSKGSTSVEKLPSAGGEDDEMSTPGRCLQLGIEQLFTGDHTYIRVCLQYVYVKLLFKIWSSSLSAKHKVHTMNTWVVAVFRYFFPLVKWPHNALVQLDRLTCRSKILWRFKSHHHSATIE